MCVCVCEREVEKVRKRERERERKRKRMKGHQTSWLSGLEGCKRQEKRMSGYSKEDSHIAELLLVDRIFFRNR